MDQCLGLIQTWRKLTILDVVGQYLELGPDLRLKGHIQIYLEKKWHIPTMCAMKLKVIAVLGEALNKPAACIRQRYVQAHVHL
jgi:hypothetical protein